MNRKLCKNRKGVSTVIATILMIMVVMIGMSVLFGALIVYSDDFHSGSGSSVLESITVEDVHFTATGVQLSLYNTGKVSLTVTNVYINGGIASPSPYLRLNIGQHGQISLTGTFTKNTSYDFKIVTSRGTGFEGTYVC